jgi:hypothetical protein
MKTPEDKSVTMTFVSHQVRDRKLRWAMNLTFPSGISGGDMLPVEVEDGEGTPVKSAVLEFAGKTIKIKDGRGELAYADFVKGKHEKAIWLKRSGMEPMPGALTFA